MGFDSSIEIVPITKEDSRVHKYEITCTYSVSRNLDQLDAPSFVNLMKKGVPMLVMDGENKLMDACFIFIDSFLLVLPISKSMY